ncbi:MAG: nuclear transport factor 2 family protein [Actinomycetes bacterium]
MTRDELERWVATYERAWRTAGTDVLADVFTEDVVYRMSPYDPGAHGLDAVGDIWDREREGPDEAFTMTASVVACDGDIGVVRVEVRYGPPRGQEWRDLWIVRLAADGRCAEFEEWPIAPPSSGQSPTLG